MSQKVSTKEKRSLQEKKAVIDEWLEKKAYEIPYESFLRIKYSLVQENIKGHKMKAKMLLQVHDELIFEVPPNEIAGLIVILKECMEHAVPLDVPLKIDVNVGFDWYDMQRV